uniref:Uncharacterized protein n=1 Tax=Avena sativa TaxID=4498 RepID=A0ACD5VC88_AVESA
MVTVGVVFVILLLLLTVPFLAAGDAFCDNLKSVAATLTNKTSSSLEHFATVTFGQAPDTIYTLALCRGDILDDSACAKCVASTFDEMLNRTPSPPQQCYKAAYYYDYDTCTLIYSANDVLSAPPNTTSLAGDGTLSYEMWNVKNDDRLIAGARIQELLAKNVEAAAASMMPMRFATAIMDTGTTSPIMYSLAQCTPDLSTGDCLVCLSHLLGMLNFTMSLRMGGRMGAIRCYFRYEAYRFYHSEPTLRLWQPSAPAPTPAMTKHKSRIGKLWIIPIVIFPLAATTILWLIYYSRRLASKVMRLQGSQHVQNLEGEEHLVWEGKNSEFSVFDFKQLMEATNNFSEENKLGQGGFGAVYKGLLPEGLEIAVKRLASHSGQGFIEFKNEVQLIAKFQHRNLVKLLGCCSQEEEKILVYEYLPNKSLDFFIFDGDKRALLDWSKQIAIIEGVAHGLLYLRTPGCL